jgi:signal peptidase I
MDDTARPQAHPDDFTASPAPAAAPVDAVSPIDAPADVRADIAMSMATEQDDLLSLSPASITVPAVATPANALPPASAPSPIVRASLWRRVAAEVTAGVQTLFSAAVYATLIVTFGFQVARVDGLSMAPTLEDHDRLIVNKLVYELGDPRPGDIVMLYYPLNPDKMFVKRVIASEGDVVRIVDGHVYVNDIPLHDDYVPEEFRSHDDWGPTVIQQGYYFVMGDHRNNSSDSRHWGQVPKKYIVGKVKVRWWPLQEARIF